MKKLYICFLLIMILVVFGVLMFGYFSNDTFNEKQIVLELYIQNVRGARMRYDEDGIIHYIGNNNCYYVGIDQNRDLYIRHGDGIAFSEYFTRIKEDNPEKMFYNGCSDLIPQPIYEKSVKLSKEEYDRIISLMEQALIHYRNEPSLDILTSVLDYDTFKFYKYRGNYFNIHDDYDIEKNVFSSAIYDDLEEILLKYMDIDEYPE